MNQALQSRACTVGSSIFLSTEAYAPEHPEGRQLLSHELVHVVQQNAAPALAPQHGAVGPSIAPVSVSQFAGGPAIHTGRKGDFTDTTKTDYIIYEVVTTKSVNHPVIGWISKGAVVYRGQVESTRGIDKRFDEHCKKKAHWNSGYKIQAIDKGKWTIFEACCYEQWYIDKQGIENLPDNKNNALLKTKFHMYKGYHKDFPTKLEPRD